MPLSTQPDMSKEEKVVNQTAEELEVICKEKLEYMLKQIFEKEKEGWSFHKEMEGIKIYTKKQGDCAMNMWMGIGIVDGPAKAIWEDIGVNGAKTRGAWDKMFDEASLIEEMVPGKLVVNHTVMKAPWPVWYRDFVAAQYFSELEGEHAGSYVDLQYSIERDGWPKELPGKKYVRGLNKGGGFLFQPVEGNPEQTLLTYLIIVDPCGWIPQWVVDQVSIDQPMVVKQVQDYWKTK